jgi:hypothetical protein
MNDKCWVEHKVITGKRLKFVLLSKKKNTDVYTVIVKSNNIILGEIKWHCGWVQYAFTSHKDRVYDVAILQEVEIFICNLMKDRKHNPITKYD